MYDRAGFGENWYRLLPPYFYVKQNNPKKAKVCFLYLERIINGRVRISVYCFE